MTLAARFRLGPALIPVAPRTSWLVAVRRLACRCVERWAAGVVALGVAGMLGFVGSMIAFGQRRLDTPAFLIGTALSLAVYSASLLVGHFGDPAELERHRPAN
jgi:hypothetical protein